MENLPAVVSQGGMLAALAKADSDSTGLETFGRYLWQAKQAVRQWLTCFSEPDGPLFVVCEQVDDLALVYVDKIRFLQLKTRDRGSWSATAMCEKGLDALVRSYMAAREVGLHENSKFELWLEGPISEVTKTVRFCIDPSSADAEIRRKIAAMGVTNDLIDDFLRRLVIRPDQPTRAHIDAKVIWELGAIWPHLSRPELHAIYDRLLSSASAAQAALAMSATIQAYLAAFRSQAGSEVAGEVSDQASIEAIHNQVLSRKMLTALTPPLATESAEKLLSRLSAGSNISLLELKMIQAGAETDTISRTKELRAEMEVERQLLLASRETAEVELDRLATSVLTVAAATARKIAMTATSNPAAASRPGEAIASDLLSRPADLAQCDRDQIFKGDGQIIYGYLGHLSDLCKFPWRAP